MGQLYSAWSPGCSTPAQGNVADLQSIAVKLLLYPEKRPKGQRDAVATDRRQCSKCRTCPDRRSKPCACACVRSLTAENAQLREHIAALQESGGGECAVPQRVVQPSRSTVRAPDAAAHTAAWSASDGTGTGVLRLLAAVLVVSVVIGGVWGYRHIDEAPEWLQRRIIGAMGHRVRRALPAPCDACIHVVRCCTSSDVAPVAAGPSSRDRCAIKAASLQRGQLVLHQPIQQTVRPGIPHHGARRHRQPQHLHRVPGAVL